MIRHSPHAVLAVRAATVLAIWLIWELVARSGLVYEGVVPSSFLVLAAMGRELLDAAFYHDMAVTAGEVLVGFAIGTMCGIAMGVVLGVRRFADQASAPYIQGFAATPKIIFLPILMLLFGVGSGSKIAMGGLSAVPRLIKIREKLTKHGGSTPRLAGRVVKPFKPAGSKSVAGAVAVPKVGGEAAVGINPAFREEDIPNIIRRDKSFIFFGEEESVTRAQLVMRPMVEVGVAVRAGVLKKRVEIKYLVLDGETGRFVELREVPVLSDGIQWLIGLTSEHIEVLRTIRPDRSMSSLEIANKLGVSREMLRRPIRELESRRLIASFRAGRSSVYRRSYSFPDIQWHDTERALEPVAIQAKSARGLIAEDSVREVLKGLIPHSDVQTFRAFFYPLYRVELMMKRRKRVVWLDGQTGEEFRP